jgi:tetratricopeptide (TPR) repeat protein
MTDFRADLKAAAARAYRAVGDASRAVDPVDAERCYRRALALDPDVASVHAGLALALLQLDRFGEAQTHLERALEADPEHEEAQCIYADLLVANGLVPQAIVRYLAGVANGAGTRLVTEFADLLARLGLRDDAEARYRAALTSEPTAEAATNLALVLVERGRLAEALAELERAIALEPGAVEARLNRANVLVELGRLDEADAAYAGLVDDPDVGPAALWGQAAVLEARGREARAAALRQAAATRAPDLADRCVHVSGTRAVSV